MIDSFINYDNNQGAPGSPFSKNFDDMFKFNFTDADLETYNLLSSQPSPPENTEQTFPKEAAFEVFSSHSGFSTNPSMKHSPEYVASPDQGTDEEQYQKPTKGSSVAKKGIRKQYEPIVDNNIVYRYEEDASEYRKARKRIQNRESATRVRNRKKTHVEELEEEMDVVRQERAELKVQNASLVAENNMLKQQITFLERIVSSRNYPEDMIDNNDAFPSDIRTDPSDSMLQFKTEPSDSILQFINKSDEEVESQPACKYFRAAPTHQFKKQVALLGVFTLLLCVYGLLPRSEPLTVQLFSRTPFAKTNQIAFALKSGSEINNKSSSDDGLISNDRPMTSFGKWMLTWSIEIVVIISYIVCLAYVGIKTYKRHHQKEKKLVFTNV